MSSEQPTTAASYPDEPAKLEPLFTEVGFVHEVPEGIPAESIFRTNPQTTTLPSFSDVPSAVAVKEAYFGREPPLNASGTGGDPTKLLTDPEDDTDETISWLRWTSAAIFLLVAAVSGVYGYRKYASRGLR